MTTPANTNTPKSALRTWWRPYAAGVLTTLALAGGVAAYAQAKLDDMTGGMMGGMMDGWHHGHGHGDAAEHLARAQAMITRQLALDSAQQAKLATLATTLQTQRQALHGSTDAAPHAQVQALIQGNAFDRSAAQALLQTKLQAVQAGGPQVITALADFYDALRPDQQQKLRDFVARGPGALGHGPAASGAAGGGGWGHGHRGFDHEDEDDER